MKNDAGQHCPTRDKDVQDLCLAGAWMWEDWEVGQSGTPVPADEYESCVADGWALFLDGRFILPALI